MKAAHSRVAIHLPTSLVRSIQADAAALDLPTTHLVAVLLADALERARARRYAPYRLPEGYSFESARIEEGITITPGENKIRRIGRHRSNNQ